MRRATTNEKQLSKNFLVQRWESELKVTTPYRLPPTPYRLPPTACRLPPVLVSNTAIPTL